MIRPFSESRRTSLLVAVLTTMLICGCGHDRKPAASAATTPVAVQPNEIAGVKAYKAGLAALGADDPEQAQGLFLDAIHQNQKLAEAWFEVGHLKLKLASELFKSDELKALQIFREGLQFEQEGRKLLDQAKVTVWSPAEVDQARAKMEVDLRDADQALADEDSLREALRLRIY